MHCITKVNKVIFFGVCLVFRVFHSDCSIGFVNKIGSGQEYSGKCAKSFSVAKKQMGYYIVVTL